MELGSMKYSLKQWLHEGGGPSRLRGLVCKFGPYGFSLKVQIRRPVHIYLCKLTDPRQVLCEVEPTEVMISQAMVARSSIKGRGASRLSGLVCEFGPYGLQP